MTNLSTKNTVTLLIVSVIAIVIGILLIPVNVVVATIILTLSAIATGIALYNLYKIIRKAWENRPKTVKETTLKRKVDWRDIVRVLTLVGVIVIIIMIAKGCGNSSVVKHQVVENQTVINQNVQNALIGNADIENADIENADINNADIENAVIENADIENADIENADVNNAEIGNVVEKEEEPKPEHVCAVATTKTVDATCTEAGSKKNYCSCGKLLSSKVIPATGHDYKVTSKVEPTATNAGYEEKTCTKCGDTTKTVLPATGETSSKFVLTISTTKVIGNSFSDIEVYTSGNAKDLIVLQSQRVFNYYVKDDHHLILSVGDVDTFERVRIYDPAHEDVVEVRRLSEFDPMA